MSTPTLLIRAATTTVATASATSTGAGDLYGSLVPSHSANLAALILYACLWTYHSFVGVYYRQWWFVISWFVACGLETAGYVGRFESSTDINNLNDFLVQIICLTLAPAFFMGGVYYLLAKLVTIYGEHLSLLKPMHYSLIFILCDLCSIVVQAIGGGMAAVAVENNNDTATGTHIMVAGMAIQIVSMVVFIVLLAQFMWTVHKTSESQYNPRYAKLRATRMFRILPFAITWCVMCVFIRCVYRLCELSEGWTGFLIETERYFLILDGLFIFLGALGLSVVHPGFVFGKEVIPVEGLHKKKNKNVVEEPESPDSTSANPFENKDGQDGQYA